MRYIRKHDIFVKNENLPKNILAFYVEINNKPYIVMNDILHSDMHEFIYYACLYFNKHNYKVGKITVFDLENKDFEPFKYARKEMKRKCTMKNIV